MADEFDPRVVPGEVVGLARAIQGRSASVLGGGAALSGLHLRHRRSRDLDFFFSSRDEVRVAAATLEDVGRECGITIRIVRDAGTFVRAIAETSATEPLEIDLLLETTAPVSPPQRSREGVLVASLVDLRAAKVTCILSRSEPRDLVDLLFLDRAGYPPEHDLAAALTKDAGVDPATLAWLLRQLPTTPLPLMLVPLAAEELATYRDVLADRFARVAVPRE